MTVFPTFVSSWEWTSEYIYRISYNVQIREIESIELKHFVYIGESYTGLNIN